MEGDADDDDDDEAEKKSEDSDWRHELPDPFSPELFSDEVI